MKKERVEKKPVIISNIKSIILYALSMTTALGFNSLMSAIFDSFHAKKVILAKALYVGAILAVTIIVAYYAGSTVI